METAGKWFSEIITPELVMLYRIHNIAYSGKTAYQAVDILDTDALGRSLVLDGKTQSSEVDEYIYHESLVHPAFLNGLEAKTVFIGGGGEGATLREILRHKSVERVVMVDLDEEVIELCKRFLPKHHQGAFDDPRVELRHEDARGYLATTNEKFDVMVMDLVDPLEGGPAYLLYTKEFYQVASDRLNRGGVLVTQAGPTGLLSYTECFTPVFRTLGTVFQKVVPYMAYVPSFVTPWGFVLAYEDAKTASVPLEDLDCKLTQKLSSTLRYYDSVTHQGMFALPRYLRSGLENEERVATDSNPVFTV